MIKQLQIYFIIVAVIAVAIGSWSARGWYEDGKVVSALNIQKSEFEAQAEHDAKILSEALIEQEAIRTAYEELKNDANKIALCTNGGNDFLRLFNRGAIEANSKE